MSKEVTVGEDQDFQGEEERQMLRFSRPLSDWELKEVEITHYNARGFTR